MVAQEELHACHHGIMKGKEVHIPELCEAAAAPLTTNEDILRIRRCVGISPLPPLEPCPHLVATPREEFSLRALLSVRAYPGHPSISADPESYLPACLIPLYCIHWGGIVCPVCHVKSQNCAESAPSTLLEGGRG